MTLGGDKLSMQAYVKNLDSPDFDIKMKGKIDFEKLANVLSLDDITLKGKMVAGIKTKGSMKDIDNENYSAIPTSGSMNFTNF